MRRPLRGKKAALRGGCASPSSPPGPGPADHPLQKRLPIPAGAIQAQQAAVHDLFPTILTLTGTAAPADHVVDGLNLDRLLTGQRDDRRGEVFLMHYPHSPHRSDYFTVYRDGPWKVIYHYFPSTASEGSHYQLFHLGNDPFEQKNLAPTHPDDLRRMMRPDRGRTTPAPSTPSLRDGSSTEASHAVKDRPRNEFSLFESPPGPMRRLRLLSRSLGAVYALAPPLSAADSQRTSNVLFIIADD
ncbi:MAG: hypothetical protein WKF75_19105 [Singulisphaera sp.]